MHGAFALWSLQAEPHALQPGSLSPHQTFAANPPYCQQLAGGHISLNEGQNYYSPINHIPTKQLQKHTHSGPSDRVKLHLTAPFSNHPKGTIPLFPISRLREPPTIPAHTGTAVLYVSSVAMVAGGHPGLLCCTSPASPQPLLGGKECGNGSFNHPTPTSSQSEEI